ncbi:MAG: F0F1 ATP synthase subunit alpha, partial [Longicatena sp.]
VRPAVDSGLSVSRVGSAAQIKAMKQVSGSLKLELAQFREMQAFAKFGSDLDATTAQTLAHGERLTQLLIQNQYDPMPVTHQVLSLFAAKHKFLKTVKTEDVKVYEKEMLKFMEREHMDIIQEIAEKQALDDTLNQKIKDALIIFEKEFKNMIEG